MRANYRDEAKGDALDTVKEFRDEILDQLKDDGEASDDLLNDYCNGDAYHHESHVDRDYDLSESAEVLDQLSEYEETDSGLWEGLEPRRAIAAQAAYTYGNAVYAYWRENIEEINEAVADAISDYEDREPDEDDEPEDHEKWESERDEVIEKALDEWIDQCE